MNNKSVKKTVLAMIFAVLIYRALNAIPTPGVNADYFKSLMESNESLGFLNSMTGGGLEDLSVMALGITPYITATIIIQLLGVIFPRITDMQRGGAQERKAIDRINLILGEVLAFMQAFVMGLTFGQNGMLVDSSMKCVILIAAIWSTGTLILALMGKHIQDVYKLNGTSVILTAGIIASWPSDAYILFSRLTGADHSVFRNVCCVTAAIILILLLFLFTIRSLKAEKRIPVVFSRAKSTGRDSSAMPLKLCPGSVVPIVFSSALIALPALIAQMIGRGTDSMAVNILNSANWLDPAHPVYSIGAAIYIGLIFFFSFYYNNVINNPIEIANNFRKTGAAIPGVRAGKDTSDYIIRENRNVLALGALALTLIAFLPIVLANIFSIPRISFLGTSVIITTGVVIEIRDTLKGKKIMHSYEERKELF